MKATVGIATPPRELLVSIEATMTLEEAKKLRDQLLNQWPAWAFSAVLSRAIDKASACFTALEQVSQ